MTSFINSEACVALMNPRGHPQEFVKHYVLPNLDGWNDRGLYYHLRITTTKRIEEQLWHYIFPHPRVGLGLPEPRSEEYWLFLEAATIGLESRIAEIAVIPDGLTLEENAVEVLQRAWGRIDEMVVGWFKRYFDAKWAEIEGKRAAQ